MSKNLFKRRKRTKKKGAIIAGILLVIGLILFLPIPTGTLRDGGTKTYSALTYRIIVWNRLIPPEPDGGSDGDTYRKTSVFWLPDNFKTVDELWQIETNAK